MSLIEDTQILPVLHGFNPWWADAKIPESLNQKIKRGAYYDCIHILREKQLHRAIVLSGPRRVGKTTILYQLAQYFIDQGVNSKDILYFSIEHPILKLTDIEQIIALYTEAIGTEKEKKIILVDEIQYTSEPRAWLKVIVDRHPEWKVVATGSASITFNQKDQESGVGRWITIPVHTLSFFEYVLLRSKRRKDITMPHSLSMLPMQLHKESQSTLKKTIHVLQYLKPIFTDFLLTGGFPETTLLHDINLSQRLLREDVVDKVLKRDMAAFYGIRTLSELEKLFVYLCIHIGLIIDQGRVAIDLGISPQQVNKLLQALSAAHLIRELPGYQQGGKKALKGKSKWYVVDSSMRNAVLLKDHQALLIDATDLGMVVEAAVVNELAGYRYERLPRLGYWRSKNKKKEVDIVVDAPGSSSVAVEVKYRKKFHQKDIQGLISFAQDKDDAVYVVVTKDDADFGYKKFQTKDGKELYVDYIPAYIFLYLLGERQYNKNR